MDLGLGNYDSVKRFVLPEAMWTDTQYDYVLQIIAKGIALRFNRYCNRLFSRVKNDQSMFDANRTHYFLPRFPLESVTMLELRSTPQDNWAEVTEAIIQQDELIGAIYFGCYLGDNLVRCRCTYSGGYFYETLEPTDEGYPTAQPEGSFALPADLIGAWLMQCLHEFQCKDRLLPEGLGNKAKSRLDQRFDQMQLLPEVANAIAQYVRMQIV